MKAPTIRDALEQLVDLKLRREAGFGHTISYAIDESFAWDVAKAALAEAPSKSCDHEWVDARNKVIESGEVCIKCFEMRAGNAAPRTRVEAESIASEVTEAWIAGRDAAADGLWAVIELHRLSNAWPSQESFNASILRMKSPDRTPDARSTSDAVDVEALLAACVPGGNVCDPQLIADSLRAWFSDRTNRSTSDAAVAVTDAMVTRFLSWQLPKTFSPDCGISFDGRKDDEWNKNKSWPVGTNLFTADEARAMLEHVLADRATRSTDSSAEAAGMHPETNTPMFNGWPVLHLESALSSADIEAIQQWSAALIRCAVDNALAKPTGNANG